MKKFTLHFKNNDVPIVLTEHFTFEIEKLELIKGAITNANIKFIFMDEDNVEQTMPQVFCSDSKLLKFNEVEKTLTLGRKIRFKSRDVKIQQLIQTKDETEFILHCRYDDKNPNY